MVKPIRITKLRFQGTLPDGLYIVGDSTVSEKSLPHLPTIGATKPTLGAFNVPLNCDDSQSIYCPELFDNYDPGDVIWVDSRQGLLRSILARNANSNTLLVTEQCDNRCSFCSQPPNDLPDAQLYHRATLSLLNYQTEKYVGISGGEPTLNRNAFLSMMRILNESGNRTPLHILTNGRSFSDPTFVSNLKKYISNRDIAWGIPLYGHTAKIHDVLVGASGAFVETVEGLMNLCSINQTIELRIIPVQKNLESLIHLMEFISTSLPFVSVISVMNLEPKGWARNNYDSLAIQIKKQAIWLAKLIERANLRGMAIRLFNYPLCLLPTDIRSYAYQSISDWKNYFPDECDTCSLKPNCCGFFTSSTHHFIETVEPLIWKN